MAVPRNPITIDTSDTFSTWLSNTNLAINVLKDIITDTVLTHADHSGAAFTAGSTITQATTGATGIVQVSTVDATTISDLGTGTWGTSNNVNQSSPTSVTLTSGHLTAVSTSHLATTGAVLTTPTITAPVIATITNNSNTLTLPTSADTLVGRATTDTLTNKTLTSPAINGGTMTSVTLVTPTLGTVANLTIANAGNIGSVGDTDAMAISSGGVVTFSQRDVHSAGITVADAGQIGSASDTDAIAIGADGDITLTQDIELQHDGAILSFGTNDDVTITHVHDTGLTIKNTHTSGNSGIGVVLTLQTGDTDIADGNILGQIKFQAPDEGSGSADQDLVAAGIAARSEGDFSDTNNATELVFNTGASEDASIGASGGDMILSSAGNLTVAGTYNGGGIMTTGGNIVIPDAGTIGSATDTDAIAIGSDGDITLTQDLELQHDAATISMGTNDDVVITHIADEGISLETTPTGTTAGTIIHFKNKRTTIADGEMIARLLFQTPSESDGSDAIVSTAEIGVKAIEAFSATANRSAVTFGFADGGTTITEALRIVPEGIKFPGTADLSTDANTLDDYEEGTWTPDMPDGGGEDAISGRYVKIGRQVIATAFINTNTTADYSNFKLTGLPFTILDDDCCGFVSMTSVTSYNYDDGSAPRFFYLTKNTDYIQGWSVSGDALEHSGRNNEVYRGNDIMFQAIYETAS